MSETRPASLDGGASRPDQMTHRTTARVVGWLFIGGTAAGITALALESPVLDAPDYLGKVVASENQVATAALLELVMGIAVVAIAVVLYPVLRRFSERLALAFVVARTVEAVIYLVGAIGLLTLLTVGGQFVAAGAPEASPYPIQGAALVAGRDWGGNVVQDVTAFTISALILNWVLYRARLVPRWLSVWGLVGAVVYLAAGVMVLYGVLEPGSTSQVLLDVPLGLQEMALALWLVVKGFNASAFEPTSVEHSVEVEATA